MTIYIFIRGPANSGKTTVAHKLETTLENSIVIHGDNKEFKTQIGTINQYQLNYEKIIRTIFKKRKSQPQYIIFEELIRDKDLYQKIQQKLIQTKSRSYWFKLEQEIDKLLEYEQTRKRKTKNLKQDFINLQYQINSINIPNEITIQNNSISETTRIIIQYINQK